MTEMSNAGVAVFVTDTTPMCRLRSDGAAALLSACSLVSCCSFQFVFPCLEVLLQGTPAPCTISCKALPGHIVDVDSLHISYADIVIRQVRTASGSPPQCQLTVEDVFWNATIIHTADMTQPSQSALSNQKCTYWEDTYWEDQHETVHQRWLLCPVRICPGYGGCFSGGMS